MTRTRPPQPQVSVIVPVYNQEQYLEECISSIRRQTLAEWECIIVNDGSSDSSGEIARRFSEEDSRILCLEQENRGVSSARNLGMRHASGRYLCFVDGDDFIDAAFLKHLLDASDRGASDLTVAGKLFCDRFPPDKIPALPTCGIFLRRYWYGESLAEIAKRYCLKLNTVKTSLYRTREKLRRHLEQEGYAL